ncbi:2-phospho-L-lactate guanylyltransferase [Roseisalinus antarcticus]|uniref:3-phospho-D-glycerate guanylyltransferase n=1 Tax=Roseisalinus antarcticus TaxID=254357 RepID=A0A1Y5TXA7_9RHOB|nr:2-phospho-L-lactate guanylyltransferase [Roseisalinus antarcticus]SLN70570.1 2-phospho-L-lactate guanylyltransferase [Roseisalinus antarcticus]
MTRHLLIPAQGLTRAKSRLSPMLPETGRAGLAEALLRDTLAAVPAGLFDSVSVVTGAADTARIARAMGAKVIADVGDGLNAALEAARRKLRRQGAKVVTVLHGDLPALTPADVIALAADTPIIAPAHDGTGTNALCLGAGLPLPYRFGPDSRARHHAAAAELGIALTELHRPGLAQDLDLPQDVARVLSLAPDGATARALRRYLPTLERETP